jgi:hypothetical protein
MVTDDFTEITAITVPYSTGTISAVEIATAEKYESIPFERRAKGWSPNSGKPPIFREIPVNTTVKTTMMKK